MNRKKEIDQILAKMDSSNLTEKIFCFEAKIKAHLFSQCGCGCNGIFNMTVDSEIVIITLHLN